MKFKQKLSVIATLFMAFVMNAQDFKGVATYKSHQKFDFNDEESKKEAKIDPKFEKQLEEQLRKQAQQEYTLSFNRNESVYKKVEQLAAPMPSSGGITIRISDGADLRYKNIKEHRYTTQAEIFGKQFLIKDSLKGQDWELLNETKNIGQYTCFKAQFKTEVKSQSLTKDGEFETVMKERIVTAWYTPQIPISNGPAEFSGLPGLILEINDGKMTLICSKIVINPEEDISITEPRKGTKVSQQEFADIMEKKSKEIMDRMRSRRGSGNSTFIKVGG